MCRTIYTFHRSLLFVEFSLVSERESVECRMREKSGVGLVLWPLYLYEIKYTN